MEEYTSETYWQVKAKLPNNVDKMVDGDEREGINNGYSPRQRKQGSEDEYEESELDGEFVKVERPMSELEETSCATNLDSSNSTTNINLSEVEKKMKELELQADTLVKELQKSESEKALLKVDIANKKLVKMNRHCEELELDRKRMKEHILETEQKYNLQLHLLQEALGALDVKHKELVGVKEAFNELSTELESSRKRIQEFEVQLVSSSGETLKFEELIREKSYHAELESKRALEFEKMLEVAKLSANEMEVQISNLQEELQGLRCKAAEELHGEEQLSSTTLELSVVQEKLDLSKSQVADLEQKFVYQEAIIQERDLELNLSKAYEEQMLADLFTLEVLLSATKENLQEKVVNLKEIELKLQEEIKARETIEASLRNQEMQRWSLQEELKKLTGEKETLQSLVADLNTNFLLTKELYSQLEANLIWSDQTFNRTDSLHSQILSHIEELEQKLKFLEQLHHESMVVVESTTRRNLELEGLVHASNAAEEEAKDQLRKTEMRLISAEKCNMELEQQLTLTGLKCANADKEITEFQQEKTVLLTLLNAMRDIEDSEQELKDSEAKRLHKKFNSVEGKIAFYQNQATEATEKVASLTAEIEASAIKLVALESTVEELMRKISESELKAGQSKLQEELVAHQSMVNELLELLSPIQAAEETAEQLASHVNTMAKFTEEHSRGLELQSATEKEVQLREAIERLTQRDSEARYLNEKFLALAAQVISYEEQISDLTTVAENRKLELEEALTSLQEWEGFGEEMRSIATRFETDNEGLATANLNLSQELEAYEIKTNGLQMALDTAISEKENALVLLQASRETIEELMQQLAFDGERLQSQVTDATIEAQSKDVAVAKPKDLRLKSKERREELSWTIRATFAIVGVMAAADPGGTHFTLGLVFFGLVLAFVAEHINLFFN